MAGHNIRTQKAAILTQSEDHSFTFDIRQTPITTLQPWEVLVKLSATGVCGTDVSLAAGYLGPCVPILGHEGVGRVVQIGPGVSPSTVALGDRIGIAWVRDVCGRCECCRHPGGEPHCLEQMNSGRKLDGTFAEYCIVPARYILQLPENEAELPDELVAPILCSGVTAYKAIKRCGATPGDWIAISGAGGGVGALGVQYAKAMGYRVAAIDLGTSRREVCLELGADGYVDAGEDNSVGLVREMAGGGVKAVIVAAGSGKAYASALPMLAAFGTLVCVGIPPLDQTMSLHPLQLIDKGITLVGTLVGTRLDCLEALEFVRRGVVKPSTTIVALEDLNQVASKIATDPKKYVVRF
ncbi:NAD(P)-binding protein [Thozetella sp. PMI_491]|nr:NAD(P)-binding protein [Thozetella sp. PMI_491]